MLYLYIKTHNITGLKYFGKTEQDPYKYKGSGIYWQKHIKKHGYDVKTEIYSTFKEFNKECYDTAVEFSVKNDIVNSNEWANLVIECGIGNAPIPLTEDECKYILQGLDNGKSVNNIITHSPTILSRKKVREFMNNKKINYKNRNEKLDIPLNTLIELINDGKSRLYISNYFGCDECVIQRVLDENNIAIKFSKKFKLDIDYIRGELYNMKTPNQIAKSLNCDGGVIRRFMKKHNLKRRIYFNADEILKEYTDKDTLNSLANKLNTHSQHLSKNIKFLELDIDLRACKINIQDIYGCINKRMSVTETFKDLGCSYDALINMIKKFNIPNHFRINNEKNNV